MNHSIVEFLSKDSSSCGYCKSSNTNVSYGMWTHTLTVQDYQSLVDRGWRRCGMYCYKPVMNEICCPAYTIRCDATKFELTKSQKKVLRKINSYLKRSDALELDEKTSSSRSSFGTESFDEVANGVENRVTAPNVPRPLSNEEKFATLPNIPSFEEEEKKTSSFSEPHESTVVAVTVKPGVGADDSKPKCKKAKLIRLERRRAKILGGQITQKSGANPNEKTLEDYIGDSLVEGVARKLELVLVPACSDEETLKESWQLFKKYQMAIHGEREDECGYSSFNHFLVVSPLQPSSDSDAPPCGYGSFHQLYKLDGKLIAVGVLDILPKCVSSVYFFYDPAFSFMSLGTYSSLREVELTRRLAARCPSLNQYYLGFYIHSCPKMRYKGKLKPSYLLCPETYTWHPIENCLAKLDASKYSQLNDDSSTSCDRATDVDQILVLADRAIVPFRVFKTAKRLSSSDLDMVHQYSRLVGEQVTKRAILRWH